jgi:hypothetical protein
VLDATIFGSLESKAVAEQNTPPIEIKNNVIHVNQDCTFGPPILGKVLTDEPGDD